MNAFCQTIRPSNRQIIINLPDEFLSNQEVEVIVLPLVPGKKKFSRKEAYGMLEGKISLKADYDELHEDFKEYM